MAIPFVIAQAAAEYGALNSIAEGFRTAWIRLESLVGPGNGSYVVGGTVLLVAFFLLKRRR